MRAKDRAILLFLFPTLPLLSFIFHVAHVVIISSRSKPSLRHPSFLAWPTKILGFARGGVPREISRVFRKFKILISSIRENRVIDPLLTFRYKNSRFFEPTKISTVPSLFLD